MKGKYLVSYTPTFAKNYQKLPKLVTKKAEKREQIFRQEPFISSLKTHKLTGKLRNYWSFSIDFQYRIVFRFISEREILFIDVGTHSIYK